MPSLKQMILDVIGNLKSRLDVEEKIITKHKEEESIAILSKTKLIEILDELNELSKKINSSNPLLAPLENDIEEIRQKIQDTCLEIDHINHENHISELNRINNILKNYSSSLKSGESDPKNIRENLFRLRPRVSMNPHLHPITKLAMERQIDSLIKQIDSGKYMEPPPSHSPSSPK